MSLACYPPDFIDIYADLDDNERARYQREYPQEAATMGTFSERFLQQGLEQGLEQGREQGLAQGEHIGVRKGEARVLLTLLRLKFGSVSEAVEAKIDQADADTLLGWSGRVLSAGSIEDVVGDDGRQIRACPLAKLGSVKRVGWAPAGAGN